MKECIMFMICYPQQAEAYITPNGMAENPV